MSPQFLAHVEELNKFLESMHNPGLMQKRMEMIESLLSLKKGDEKYPSRASIASEASFMLKSKERICKAIDNDKYLEVFQKVINFLEENPPAKNKKKKTAEKLKEVLDSFQYTAPTAGTYTTSAGMFAGGVAGPDDLFQYTVTFDTETGRAEMRPNTGWIVTEVAAPTERTEGTGT